ncbi:MAG: hypothetical protein H7263_14045, partial [Candidatus Sericytochromatia bacterium]|nr:hypothetical protein [Candidatus Sericytochromatia bacterium]
MYNKKIINLATSLVLAFGIFSCSQQTPNTVSSSASSSQTAALDTSTTIDSSAITQVSTGDSNSATSSSLVDANTNTTLASGANFNTAEIKDTMIAYHDTDNVFRDSEALNKEQGDASFGVKAVDLVAATDIYATLKNVKTGELRDTLRAALLSDLNDQRAAEAKAQNQLKGIENREKVDNNLLARLQVHGKKYQVKRSQVISIDNGDGTITRISQVEFKRGNVLKVNKESKTYDKATKKLIKIIHNFNEKAGLYSREAVRVAIFNSTGGRTVTTEATTKFKDGKVRVVNETRILDVNGNGTGTGVVTVTTKDGKVTTYNINMTITVFVASSSVKDPNNSASAISVNQQANGTATVTTGTTTATTDISNAAEGSTPTTTTTVSPSPAASASPAASSSPTVSASPIAAASSSPAASASPTAAVSSSPAASASPIIVATSPSP